MFAIGIGSAKANLIPAVNVQSLQELRLKSGGIIICAAQHRRLALARVQRPQRRFITAAVTAQLPVNSVASYIDEAACSAPGDLVAQNLVQSSVSRKRERGSIVVSESGAQFLQDAIRAVDTAWRFFTLPHHWPASVLVQYCEKGVVSDTWFPLVVKSTFKIQKPASSVTTAKVKTAESKERTFLFHKIGYGPFLNVLVAPESGLFFMAQSAVSCRFFRESEQVSLDEILVGLRAEWTRATGTGSGTASKAHWFRHFSKGMISSTCQAMFCGALASMQKTVYGPAGMNLSFPDPASNSPFNSYVDCARVLHRVPAYRSGFLGRALNVVRATSTNSRLRATRPYTREEMERLDFLCALNYSADADELLGFYVFPRDYLLKMFAPIAKDGRRCRSAYWIYFPEDAHGAKREGVKERIIRDMEFYIDLRETSPSEYLEKFRNILMGKTYNGG
ncbi:unnamed protein product [Amoebophrya sp. A120]|nr:unnamed protein product [Amoebophrya sp. A120]|eukprot:GSA120T00020196001.1